MKYTLFFFFSILILLGNGVEAAQLTFSWIPNNESSLAGYKIHYGTASRNYTNVIDAGNPDPIDGRIQATVDGLEEGTTYYFAATAYDQEGNESEYSTEISHTIDDPVITPTPTGTANFSWLPNSESSLAGYKIHYGTASRNYSEVIDIGNPAPVDGRINGSVTGLNEGTTYYFAATAYDQEGNESDYSTEIVYTVPGENTNSVPTANDVVLSGDEDSSITGSFSVEDESGQSLDYTITNGPGHGTLSVEDDTGQFTYRPAPDFFGNDAFSYTAANTTGTSNTATVSITITPVNDAPVARVTSLTTEEDHQVSGQLTATDVDSNTLSFSLSGQAAHGSVSLGEDGAFTYVPVTNYNGSDSFTFTVSDGNLDSDPTTVSITVTAVNDLPVAQGGTFTLQEDALLNGRLSGTDPDGDNLTYQVASQAGHGTATISSDGSFSYAPNADYAGTDQFTFLVSDGQGNSSPATVSITIQAVNDAPTAQGGRFTTNEDTPLQGQVVASDIDGDSLTYSVITAPQKGTLSFGSNGSFTYQPSQDQNGADSFTFQVRDPAGATASATISLDITPVNDTPVASSQDIVLEELSEPINGQLSGSDPDGDQLSFTVATSPRQGNLVLQTDGTFTYTAGEGAEGTDSFTFTVSDGLLQSSPATVNIELPETSTEFQIEINEIEVGSDWQAVSFANPFTHPVVLARVTSINDSEPGVIRMRHLTTSGVEIRFQEWDSLDGSHAPETVALMIVEQGSFKLDDDSGVETACLPISGAASFTPITFQNALAKTPVVVTSIITASEADAVTTRIRSVTASGFELSMQEQEANPAEHGEEQVCYLAWEPSSGMLGSMRYEAVLTDDSITDKTATIAYESTFAETPLVLAAMQTSDGSDTARLRYAAESVTDLSLYVAEEQSRDTETSHTTEQAGYLAFSPYDPDADPDKDGLSTGEEEQTYHTHPGLTDTDGDGLNDGDELSYWQEREIAWDSDLDNDGLINLLDQDSDGDGTTDNAEITADSDPADPDSTPGLPPIEGGVLEINHNWVHVDFDTTFKDPVLMVRQVSKNGNDPCLVRIRNLTGTGFDLRIQEYDYLDGSHVMEQVHYLVMEQGHYSLADGTPVEAGHFTTSATGLFVQHAFSTHFDATPVVITNVLTSNGEETVTSRVRNITGNGFELTMQEQEANDGTHAEESIAYIAMGLGSGSTEGMRYEALLSDDILTHATATLTRTQDFEQVPLTFCAMQSADGMDTARLRVVNMTPSSLDVIIQEEQSNDSETWHTTEQGGCISLEPF